MAASCERALDSCCEKFHFGYAQKVNDFLERIFFKFGEFLADYAPLVLGCVATSLLLLGLGIFTSYGENDIFKLWIEKNSRLHAERSFNDEYFNAVLVRQQFIVASPKEGESHQIMQRQYLADYYKVHDGYRNLTYRDPHFGRLGMEDVCARSISTPLVARGIFRALSLQGFPCSRATAMDCWKEGDYTMNLDALALSIFGFPNAYDYKPSLYTTTLEENLRLASSQDQCQMWAGTRYPEGFMFAGIQRTGDDNLNPQEPIIKLSSLQTVFDLMTPDQLAQKRCVTNCSVAKSCGPTTMTCIGNDADPSLGIPASGCYAKGLSTYAPICIGQYAANTSVCPLISYCLLYACSNMTAGNCPSLMYPLPGQNWNMSIQGTPFPAPYCHSCNLPNYLSPQPCYGCALSCVEFGMANDPLCESTITNCATDMTKNLCIKECFANGTLCEYPCLSECTASVTQTDVDNALSALQGWEQAYIDYMDGATPNLTLTLDYWAAKTTDDLVTEAGKSDSKLIIYGYVGMIIFASVVLWQFDALRSKVTLGFLGTGLVIISVFGALGLTALSDVPFSPTVVQVLPFLAIGLGLQEMFVLSFAYQYRPDWTIKEQIADLMRDAGIRGTLAASVNFVSFAIAIAIPLPLVSQLAIGSTFVIIINWIILFTAFVSLIAINAKRIEADRIDVFCCFKAKSSHKELSVIPDHVGSIPQKIAETVMWMPMRVFLLCFAIVVFGVAMWGAKSLELGLPLSDIVPRDTYAYGFLHVRDQYYGGFKSGVVVGMVGGKYTQLDYTDPQIHTYILEMEAQMSHASGNDPYTPMYATSAMSKFLVWFNTQLRPPLDTDPSSALGTLLARLQSNNQTAPLVANANTTTDAFADSSTFPANLLFHTSASGKLWQDFCDSPIPCHWVKPTFFNMILDTWLSSSDGIFYLDQFSRTEQLTPDTIPSVTALRLVFLQSTVYSDQDAVNNIRATRHVTDHAKIPCYPAGFVFDLYEQYVNVEKYLGEQLGYAAIGVVLISWIFLLHPGAVLILGLVVAVITSEIYGFLYFFSLKLNGVCVINLVFSVASSVEFCVHIVRLFMVTPGTRSERATSALARMIYPMLFSATATFLGNLPLLFARFPYFVLYFFDQIILILILGVFNGLVTLPILLSFIGPPTLGGFSVKDAATNVELPQLEEGEEEHH